MEPEAGQKYYKRGFEFQVVAVENGMVYVRRWKSDDVDDMNAQCMRIAIETWRKEMAESDEVTTEGNT